MLLLIVGLASNAFANEVPPSVQKLIATSCIACHEAGSENGLDFEQIATQINDESFSTWERVYDRVSAGEMPPSSEERPEKGLLNDALSALKDSLHVTSKRRQQAKGRVLARRLTKLELQYTLQDLLDIQQDVTVGIPDEVESGSFDTVGAAQRISAVHMESYLEAADKALDAAIDFGPNPYHSSTRLRCRVV